MTNFAERLESVNRVFLDTAPMIYWTDWHARYITLMEAVFDRLDADTLQAVVSPVTFAECLVMPYRTNRVDQQRRFTEALTQHRNIAFVGINAAIADSAAQLRARYNLELDDAFQIAVALQSKCEIFLTNDLFLRRAKEIEVIVLDDMLG